MVLTLFIAYVIVGIGLFAVQKNFIYYPDDADFYSCQDAGKTAHYNGTRFYENRISDTAVVFYHGNAGSACDRSIIRDKFEKLNISTIIVEYSGYSNDSKSPGKSAMLSDVDNIMSYLDNAAYSKVYVMGSSIGGFFASHHASKKGNDLILAAPASSIVDVGSQGLFMYPLGLMLTENQDNILYLEDYNSSIVIFHGTEDKVINPRFSQKLFDSLATEKKEYILVNGSGHNDILTLDEVWDKIAKFTAS